MRHKPVVLPTFHWSERNKATYYHTRHDRVPALSGLGGAMFGIRVVDTAGKPVVNATVETMVTGIEEGLDRDARKVSGKRIYSTNDFGTFKMDTFLSSGRVDFRISKPGYQTVTGATKIPASGMISVQLKQIAGLGPAQAMERAAADLVNYSRDLPITGEVSEYDINFYTVAAGAVQKNARQLFNQGRLTPDQFNTINAHARVILRGAVDREAKNITSLAFKKMVRAESGIIHNNVVDAVRTMPVATTKIPSLVLNNETGDKIKEVAKVAAPALIGGTLLYLLLA